MKQTSVALDPVTVLHYKLNEIDELVRVYVVYLQFRLIMHLFANKIKTKLRQQRYTFTFYITNRNYRLMRKHKK